MNIEGAKVLLRTALPCPWCGIQPVLQTKRVGHRDDPDRVVYLECSGCAVSKKVYVLDSDQDKAHKLDYRYETAVAIVCLERVLTAWNMRKN